MPADAVRLAVGDGLPALCSSQAFAAPSVAFLALGAGHASASAEGAAQAQFFGRGAAQGDAYVQGQAHRRIRMRFQPPARGEATAEGELVSYILLYGEPALSRAWLVGTTYQVGRGVAAARAQLTGDAQKSIGARQYARAEATASGGVVHTVGCVGRASASAHAVGYPAVTVAGVRYQDIAGRADATAHAPPVQMLVFQPQTMRARANASAWAVQMRGFRGLGTATARASGYMDMTYTGQVGAPAQVVASALAYAVRHAVAGGRSTVAATCAAAPQLKCNGAGRAFVVAQVSASEVHLRLRTMPAAAAAQALAAVARIVIAGGAPAHGIAQAAGYNQINDLAPAPERRTLRVLHTPRATPTPFEDRTIRTQA